MKRGFTLLEVVLVISVLAILGAIASISYNKFWIQNQVDQITVDVVFAIRKTRTLAQNSKEDDAWGIKFSTSSYTIFKGSSYATRNTTYDLLVGIDDIATLSGLSEISFSKYYAIPSVSGQINIIAPNGYDRTININSKGTIEY